MYKYSKLAVASKAAVAFACFVAMLPLDLAEAALPSPPDEAARATVSQDELRLATVGYRLSTTNSGRCDAPEMMTGLIVHSLNDYDESLRAKVIKQYDLTNGVGVLSIVPGSSGDMSGLRLKDVIVAINGKELEQASLQPNTGRASYKRTDQFEEDLSDALKVGAVSLKIRRAGSYQLLTLKGQPGCGGKVSLDLSHDINAWSDGKYVAVTRKLVDFAASDDELAFVVAHEMAHNILHHFEKTNDLTSLLAEFGIGASKIKKSEATADATAIKMLDRANYDTTASIRFLQRSRQVRILDLPITHPGISTRLAIVGDEIAREKSRYGSDTK